MKYLLFGLEVVLSLILVWCGADMEPDVVRVICGIMVTCFILCLIIPNKPSKTE